MVSSRILFTLVAVPLFAAAAVIACGDDGESKTVPTVDGGTSSSGGSSSGSSGTTSSGGSSGSSGGADAECAVVEDPEPPNLDGGGPCGTLDFGQPAVAFVVDAGAFGDELDAGAFPPGIYDTVYVESPLQNGGTWRETTVVGPNGRFTRVRELRPGASNDPASYVSGTITKIEGGSVSIAVDCRDGDAGLDASTSFPVKFVQGCGTTYFTAGAGNTRAYMKRR